MLTTIDSALLDLLAVADGELPVDAAEGRGAPCVPSISNSTLKREVEGGAYSLGTCFLGCLVCLFDVIRIGAVLVDARGSKVDKNGILAIAGGFSRSTLTHACTLRETGYRTTCEETPIKMREYWHTKGTNLGTQPHGGKARRRQRQWKGTQR